MCGKRYSIIPIVAQPAEWNMKDDAGEMLYGGRALKYSLIRTISGLVLSHRKRMQIESGYFDKKNGNISRFCYSV